MGYMQRSRADLLVSVCVGAVVMSGWRYVENKSYYYYFTILSLEYLLYVSFIV